MMGEDDAVSDLCRGGWLKALLPGWDIIPPPIPARSPATHRNPALWCRASSPAHGLDIPGIGQGMSSRHAIYMDIKAYDRLSPSRGVRVWGQHEQGFKAGLRVSIITLRA